MQLRLTAIQLMHYWVAGHAISYIVKFVLQTNGLFYKQMGVHYLNISLNPDLINLLRCAELICARPKGGEPS